MTLNSFSFIGFLIIVLLISLFANSVKKRNIILLAASFIFYCFASIKLSFVLVFYILSIYYCGLNNKTRLGVVFSIIFLGIFKYYNFFAESLAVITNINFNIIKIVAPLGVSFYCFRGISYLIDIRREKIEIENNILNLALYISYFPEIISGPISRYRDLKPQYENYNRDINNVFTGLQIFLIGLFKKVVLADNLATYVSNVYTNVEIYSSLTVFLVIIAYSLEIYLDFSGYSDMSIGVSKMLGFEIKKNFDMPYISKNVTEFWKRWHISLSSWLQEYLYYGLGGNRKGKTRQFINLFLTMAIGGLWHGASFTFIIWGCIQGIALIIHKIFMSIRKEKNISIIFSIIITNCFITLSWIPFRSSSFKEMILVFKQLFGFKKGVDYFSPWAIVTLIIVIIGYCCVILKNKHQEIHSYYPIQDLSTVKGLYLMFVLIMIIIGFGYTGGSPFIYASF